MQGTNANLIMGNPDSSKGSSSSSRTVAWRRSRHWVLPETHQLLERLQNSSSQTLLFESGVLSRPRLAFLTDHKVAGSVLFPGSGFFELAAAAGRAALGGNSIPTALSLTDLSIAKPLRIPESMSGQAAIVLCALSLSQGTVQITSRLATDQNSVVHMTAYSSYSPASASLSAEAPATRPATRPLAGIITGTALKAASSLTPDQHPSQSVIECLPDRMLDAFWLSPAAFDSALQLGQLSGTRSGTKQGTASLRIAIATDFLLFCLSSAMVQVIRDYTTIFIHIIY